MIRIVHLTDFHLNTKTLRDWKNFIKDSLIIKLKELNQDQQINIIAFTGDLIDKGGEDFEGAPKAFEIFKEEVIVPLLEELDLPTEQFIIIPGNHDIERDLDHKRQEIGNLGYLTKEEHISDYINNAILTGDLAGIARINSFKQFEAKLYKDYSNKIQSIFEASYVIDINGISVGISALNSSWRCYNKDDIGNLLIGEEQLIRNYKFIEACQLKIALVHHPLDWLSLAEKGVISSHIHKDYDILLLGHVHSNSTTMSIGFNGTLFTNVAPSGLNDIRSDSRTYSNGFSIVDYDLKRKQVNCKYFRYNHDKKAFVINTDVGHEGEYSELIPTPKAGIKNDTVKEILKNIEEDHFKKMDEHFIGVKADILKASLKSAFVLPPIDEGNRVNADEQVIASISLTEIVKRPENIMFFGAQESGKTSLLYRLVREYTDEFEFLQKIPVYIAFEELGNKEILTVIKNYLRCGTDTVKILIEKKAILLLIDNLNYKFSLNNNDKLNKLHRFNKDHPSIQIIATAEQDLSGIIPTDYLEHCKIVFKPYFIRTLRTKEIKSIMKQWIPEEDELKADDRLEKLVHNFKSYSLPSSPMSVSLFLWSMENKERKPINHAVLMDIYLEIILEKLNKENIYRDTFDYTNKLQLIAKIAHEMLVADHDNYVLSVSEFTKVIEQYLSELVGFHYDPTVIIQYLFERKIFNKNENTVKFANSCFFHFFLAKRMEYDPDFKEYVMSEDRYYQFPKEIDYYTGLVRSDITVFKTIFDRFEKEFQPTEFILNDIKLDEYFTVKADTEREYEPKARNLEIAKIKANRPTEEKIEANYDKQLERISQQKDIVNKKDALSYDRLLLIMCNVLRNSEGVENLNLKKEAYEAIIKYNLTYSVLYTQVLVQYVLKHNQMPPSFPTQYTLHRAFTNMPYILQNSLTEHLGTTKLGTIILDKIKNDRTGRSISRSDVESYLSVALYSDIQAPGFDVQLKAFIKSVKAGVVQDYLLSKLQHYYYRRTKDGSTNEQMYLDFIVDLRIRAQKLPKRLRESFIKSLTESKKRFLN